jgi:hypothetical protein
VTLLNGTLTEPALGSPGAVTTKGLGTIGPPGATLRLPYDQSWNLTVERQIVPNAVLSLAYVGEGSPQLTGPRDLNFPLPVAAPSLANPNCLQPGQTIPAGGFNFDPCLNRGLVSSALTRPFQGWSGISTSGGSTDGPSSFRGTSNYNSLQVGFRYQPGTRLTVTTAYTYSKTLSDVAQRGTTGGGNENVGAQDSPQL